MRFPVTGNAEAESIMVLDLSRAAEVLWQPITHDIRRITDPVGVNDVVAILQQVWDEDHASLGEYLQETLRRFPQQMSITIAYVDDQPASTMP